jgi:hypothetical protein
MIYFIGFKTTHIKIGYTSDLNRRIKELQTGCPFKLKVLATMQGDSQTEAGLHLMFASKRAVGEWFRAHGDLEYFVKAVKSNPELTNIKTLKMEAQKLRLLDKAKRNTTFKNKLKKYDLV